MVSKLIGVATFASFSAIAIAALAAYRHDVAPRRQAADAPPRAATADPKPNVAGRTGKPGHLDRGEEGHDRDDD